MNSNNPQAIHSQCSNISHTYLSANKMMKKCQLNEWIVFDIWTLVSFFFFLRNSFVFIETIISITWLNMRENSYQISIPFHSIRMWSQNMGMRYIHWLNSRLLSFLFFIDFSSSFNLIANALPNWYNEKLYECVSNFLFSASIYNAN